MLSSSNFSSFGILACQILILYLFWPQINDEGLRTKRRDLETPSCHAWTIGNRSMLPHGTILFLAILASISVNGTIIHLVAQNKNLRVIVDCSLSLTPLIEIISKSNNSSSLGLLPKAKPLWPFVYTTAIASSIFLILIASTVAPYSFTSTHLSVILLKDKSHYIISLPSVFQCFPIILRIKFKVPSMACKPTQDPTSGKHSDLISYVLQITHCTPRALSLIYFIPQNPSRLRAFTLCLEYLCTRYLHYPLSYFVQLSVPN